MPEAFVQALSEDRMEAAKHLLRALETLAAAQPSPCVLDALGALADRTLDGRALDEDRP